MSGGAAGATLSEQNWWIGVPVRRNDVKVRLNGRARAVGLYGTVGADPPGGFANTGVTAADDHVWILVREARR
jgi:hypothetical protein